jgi:hypothetical protein
MDRVRVRVWVLAVAVWLVVATPARAELRIGELDVFLNDFEVTVHAVALGAVPATFLEPIQSGIAAHVRFTVELWQFTPYWRDRLLTTKVIERHLTYNVVSKEYRVTFVKGETRPVYTTRDLRDAQRVLSEMRAAKLTPASALGAEDVIYVRLRAETALNGENTWVARVSGMAEQTFVQSDYRTLKRVQ